MNPYLKHVDDPLHTGWMCTSLREDEKGGGCVGKGTYRGWQRWRKGEMFIDFNHPQHRGQWIGASFTNPEWYPLGDVKNLKEAIEVIYMMERLGPYEMATA